MPSWNKRCAYLLRIARKCRENRHGTKKFTRGGTSATLSPTALVNEAWLKLADSRQLATTSKLHFKRIAARAMRQLLVEAARRRHAGKRGGGVEVTVSFDESLQKPPSG